MVYSGLHLSTRKKVKMEGCVEDAAVLCTDDPQHCSICGDNLTTSTSVKLQSNAASVTAPASLGVGDKVSVAGTQPEGHDTSVSPPDTSVSPPDTEASRDSHSNIRTVRTVLSSILRPLQRTLPAGDALCRLCCRLVVQVDVLRTQADTLEARLLARLDRGETRVTELEPAAAAEGRPGRSARAARGRPETLETPETPSESQNFIAAQPPPSSARRRRAPARSALIKWAPHNLWSCGAPKSRSSSSSALISIEICRGDDERTSGGADPAEGTVASDVAETEETEDTAADSDGAGSPAPATAPSPPPPADPAPTFVRQEQNSQCGVCELQLESRAACRDHMRAHQAKRVYFCPLCPAALMARNALEAHETERHADSPLRPYGCGQCDEMFPTPRFLRRHKEAAHGRLLPCAHCRRTFRRQGDLDSHQMVHTGQRPYTCDRCGKSFTKQPVWRQHLRTHGRRPRPFQCAECPRAFLSDLHLARHSLCHRQQALQCELCDRRFTTEARFRKHTLQHSAAKIYACDACSKSFSKKSLLADHTRTHTGEKPFICEHCGAGFAQRSNLRAHKSAVHLNEKPFECPICKKAFKRKLLLTLHHRSIHSGERPSRCSLCSATFVSTQQLRAHQKTHRTGPLADRTTSGRPYRCGVCGRAFTTEERCHAHMVSAHSDKRPFECRECGGGFQRRAQLLAHMEQQGHGSGPGDYIINQPILQTAPPQPPPLGVKAPASGQFVVQTVAADGSTIYEQVELTVTPARPPGETPDRLQTLEPDRAG